MENYIYTFYTYDLDFLSLYIHSVSQDIKLVLDWNIIELFILSLIIVVLSVPLMFFLLLV